MKAFIRRMALLTLCVGLLGSSASLSTPAFAADAKGIDADADFALKEFTEKIAGSEEFLKSAKGILVFPALYKAGFIFGAEYGDGVLRIGGKTVGYYNLAAASFGFQAGAQKTSLIIMFMKDLVLEKFQKSSGFELGVDANATLVTVGAQGSLDTTKLGEPILAFAFGQRGLMAGVTLEGAKFTKRDLK
ncbi:MAG: hypothetical protein EPO64_10100 [Nitrospirae bacterium]|nr:MAG: hypothetical protein EPO64_10100 [Nitrospirota bacterium]